FVKGTMSLKGIDVTNFRPYVEERVNLILTDGTLSAKGRFSTASGETGLKASFSGEALLADFASIDGTNAEDFLRWKSLFIGGIEYGTSPSRLTIREIALADFYSRFIINADGSLNVKEVLSAPSAQDVAKQASRDAPKGAVEQIAELQRRISIERISVQGGTINFSDFFIKPNYRANLLDIGGRVSGLSSDAGTAAEVELRGNVDNYAPIEITGRMNLLRKDLLLDIKGNFGGIELSPVTPYAAKYLGYTIQKGKLSMKVQYKVVKNKLAAKNEIFIDQLALGEHVESTSATKLPVKLGIALLKDRRGEINLDLPVSGNIDEPKFSLGRIIIQILTNLLVKAATSPFALLGAIFGGGEELNYIEFEYGSAVIDERSAKKLEKLVKALADRPGLELEVSGHVDRQRDAEGLKQSLLQKRVRAQKLREITRGGKPSMPLEEVAVTSEEYPKYLKMAYGEEKFPKPRNFLGIAKDLPVPEMEKLMVTNLEVTEEDLKILAADRARSVKDYVLKSTQVEPERVFLVEPKTLEPEPKENLKDSRVDFRLK
ncbi:MAG TPA: DUF748 domain-containing protein, partial [Syntrophobacteria bacterium]|nr:DUF748 domain-containing protein [Syntrophobacteria bacterium]